MIQIFRGIIGEFPVFDLVGGDPIKLIDKFSKAASSSITIAISLTSTVGSNLENGNVYSLQQRKLDMDKNEPEWKKLPLQNGVIMWYCTPETLGQIKNPGYFNKSNLFSKNFSFKIAPNPFSAGVERYAYFAIDVESDEPEKKMVIKEYLSVGKGNPFEKYLEAVEVSAVACFLSTKFNSIAKKEK